MTEIFANNAGGVLAADVLSTDTSFSVETGHTFPAPGAGDFFRATLWDVTGGEEVNHEIVKVTDVTNNVLTVERAQEGTSASAWSTGTEIELRFTAGALDGFIHRDPEHATDSGTDAFVSATNTTPPAAGVTITRDFQSANITTTPTLDTLTITTRDGSALWADALSGVHNLQLNAGGTAWLVLDPVSYKGAIVESGTNANGSYVRWENGEQVCWHYPRLTYESAPKLIVSWTYPAAFTSTPVIPPSPLLSSFFNNATPPFDAAGPTFVDNASSTAVVLTLTRIRGQTDFASGDFCDAQVLSWGFWK